MKRKAVFSASGIFQNVGTMLVTTPAITRAGRILLEQKEDKRRQIAQNKENTKLKREQEAQEALHKFTQGERMLLTDWKKVVMYVLPKTGSTEAPSKYNTMAKIQERLNQLEKPWHEYIMPQGAVAM